MSAIIRSIKTNIAKNKITKNFSKTITSNFMKSSPKTPKIIKEFLLTRSTRFSDNNLTNTLASSLRTISKNKLRKKEKRLYLNLDDFHKQFILYKNNENNMISNIYKNNNYNKKSTKYLSNKKSSDKNENKLKIRSFQQSLGSSLEEQKSRNFFNKEFQTYSNISSSFFKNIYDTKTNNKIIYNRNDNLNKKSITNYSEENFNNNIYNYLIVSPRTVKSKLTDKSSRKTSNNIKQNYFNYINLKKNNNKFLNNNKIYTSIKDIICKKDNNTNKNKNALFNYQNSKKISLNEQLAYPPFDNELLNPDLRAEKKEQFLYKTRIIILDKYIRNINKDKYFKQLSSNENIIEKQQLQKRKLEITKQLFNSYNKTLDEYIAFLNKKVRKMKEENEILKENRANFNKDIEKLKQKIRKDMNKIRETFSIKYFLMCVKNHTISMNKFTDDDIEEIENDRLKLNEDYYLNNKKRNQKINKSIKINKVPFNSPIKRSHHFSSDKELKLYNNFQILRLEQRNATQRKSCITVLKKVARKPAVSVIIRSPEEFFDHFDIIASNLNNLMKTNIDIYSNNIYLKKQLEKMIESNTSFKSKDYNPLNNQIILLEQKLEILKKKNRLIFNQYNELKDKKFQNDIKIKLVMKTIYNIYNNIKRKYTISNVNEDDLLTFGDKIYLKKIERFFFDMMNKVSKDKIKYPSEYKIIKQQIDKRQKKEAFFAFQRLLAQKIQIKIDTVLNKASKFIYRRYRKTNDYKEYYKNFKAIQSIENRKNDEELFFEFIDNNNNEE